MKNVLMFLVLLVLVSNVASGVTEITINDVEKPRGAVLFIVDGLGSSYFYPEFTPAALDESELLKTTAKNLTHGTRIIDIVTPHPVTGIAHSVIVTGYSKADQEIVGSPDATIFDITRHHGFINIAVMQKGDFLNMRNEQDMILFAENNSIDEPLISIQTNIPHDDINEFMYEWKSNIQGYLDKKSGVERYSFYNKWGIDSANALVKHMIKEHPNRKFLLTVNIGAIDSGGHYLGSDDYITLIEELDRDFYSLYETAVKNDIALFFTADHGMSFAGMNAQRGGHSSDKYKKRSESLRIPLVIISPNTRQGTFKGEYRQEDIAPTILSVLDLPDNLLYKDGSSIIVKNYASIFIESYTDYSVSLWKNDIKVSESQDSELIFSGLALNTNYTIKAKGPDGTYEENVALNSDKQISFSKPEPLFDSRQLVAIILILMVNITGLVIIKRIKD